MEIAGQMKSRAAAWMERVVAFVGTARVQAVVACAAFALAACAAEPGPAPAFAEIDLSAAPIRDLSKSTCFPILGTAGAMVEANYGQETLLTSNRAETAAILRRCGVYFMREWDALGAWRRNRAWAALKTPEERDAFRKANPHAVLVDPMTLFSFRKENNMRVLLTLEQWNDGNPDASKRTNDVIAVREAVREYVRWIVKNGFKETVAGFELGNETYFHPDAEGVASRWRVIIPAILDEWPDAKIGIPLAEYVDDDPDLQAVRNRLLSAGKMSEDDTKGLSPERLGRWSARFIAAFSNDLSKVTHLVYHFYGGDVAYGCGACGFFRIERFKQAFPEIADKPVWVTECRERSDEDNRCQQTFFSTVWKAHYFQLCLSRPYVESVNVHCIECLSGVLYIASGGRWLIQWDSAGREYRDLDYTGRTRLTEGPAAPLYRLYNEAILAHPILHSRGVGDRKHKTLKDGVWMAPLMYEGRAAAAEWTLLLSPKGDSAALLMVNSAKEPATVRLKLSGGRRPGAATVRSVTCPPERYRTHAIPGEPFPWTEREESVAADGDVVAIPIRPLTVQTATFPLK